MLHVENNIPKHPRSQQEARLKGYNLLAHECNDKEYREDIESRFTSLHKSVRKTFNFIAEVYAVNGKCFTSLETIARRGRGKPFAMCVRTASRHVAILHKIGLINKTYRHMKTSTYELDPWFIKNRDYFRELFSSVKFLSLSLLLSAASSFSSNVMQRNYKLNTNTSSSQTFSKNNLPLNNLSLSDYYVSKKGLLMNAIPQYVLDITELNLEPAGAIELSAFEEADILYGRRALRKQTVKLGNPFAWLVSVCKVSATNHGRQPNWVLVNQMKMIAQVTDKCLRYTEVEGREGLSPYGSSSMNYNNNKRSIKGKAKDAAYQAYVPDERKPDEDPLVAAFKVAANCVFINYYFGNPWYDKLTLEQKAALHAEYPTYAKLARIEPVLLGQGYEEHVVMPVDASKTLPAESLFKTEPYTLNVEEEPMWEEISEVVSGMANFKSSPLDVNNLPTYTPETDEVDDLLNSYHPLPTRGRDISSQTHFKSVGSVIESLGTSLS